MASPKASASTAVPSAAAPTCTKSRRLWETWGAMARSLDVTRCAGTRQLVAEVEHQVSGHRDRGEQAEELPALPGRKPETCAGDAQRCPEGGEVHHHPGQQQEAARAGQPAVRPHQPGEECRRACRIGEKSDVDEDGGHRYC